MPWKEYSLMVMRLRFVATLPDGEAMSEVCRGFGISRKTGYKIFSRYKDQGIEALSDRSRRRYCRRISSGKSARSCIIFAARPCTRSGDMPPAPCCAPHGPTAVRSRQGEAAFIENG